MALHGGIKSKCGGTVGPQARIAECAFGQPTHRPPGKMYGPPSSHWAILAISLIGVLVASNWPQLPLSSGSPHTPPAAPSITPMTPDRTDPPARSSTRATASDRPVGFPHRQRQLPNLRATSPYVHCELNCAPPTVTVGNTDPGRNPVASVHVFGTTVSTGWSAIASPMAKTKSAVASNMCLVTSRSRTGEHWTGTLRANPKVRMEGKFCGRLAVQKRYGYRERIYDDAKGGQLVTEMFATQCEDAPKPDQALLFSEHCRHGRAHFSARKRRFGRCDPRRSAAGANAHRYGMYQHDRQPIVRR